MMTTIASVVGTRIIVVATTSRRVPIERQPDRQTGVAEFGQSEAGVARN
jgi:hypothetical protein